ncbi:MULTISPECIES: hypothetical protein [Delftia]|uniref:Uncharacterized protein n=1 Tax=Delftia lacustris TaxID=558537 RepID=A0A7T2YZN6_9BURK|nr:MULTISPECIES: hypothetical protein [Delftia]KAA9167891.1 hypothetical protein F3K36_22990 [Delftia sp. BR1]QPS84777.1 hypothetical protein I6G47_23325 [Delftia lacustris]
MSQHRTRFGLQSRMAHGAGEWPLPGLLGGLLSRGPGFNTGVQFMGYYTAVLSVPALVKLF